MRAVEGYLRLAKGQPGFDIKTAMCLLAVEKSGNYAPADRKVTKWLLLRQVVTEDEAGTLERKDVGKFVSVYVDKVLPIWWRERETRTARTWMTTGESLIEGMLLADCRLG